QCPAALIIGPGIVAADAYFNKVGRRDSHSRADEPLPLLRKAGKAGSNGVVRACPGAADGKVGLRNSQQRRRRIDEIGAAAEPAGGILGRIGGSQFSAKVSVV